MNLVYKKDKVADHNSETNLKKLFVYDTSRGVAAEIRKKFGKEYNVVCCFRAKDLIKFNLSDFFAAIVILNEYDDHIRLATLSRKIKNLIISSSLKKNNFSIPYFENSYTFDLFLPRETTVNWLREKLVLFDKKIKMRRSS